MGYKTKSAVETTNTAETTDLVVSQTIDLARFIAENKAKPLLWGEGWDITDISDKDKSKLLDILDWNGFDGLLYSNEEELSTRLEGNQLWIVQPSANGKVLINLADMDMLLYRGTQNGKLLWVRTGTYYYSGLYNYIVYQIFSDGVMKTIINRYNDETHAYDIETPIKEFNNENQDYQLLDTWEYGDVIPLVMMTNKSSTGLEDAGDGIAVRNLQDKLNNVYYASDNELFANSTKILGKLTPAELKSLNQGISAKYIQNTFVQTDGADNKIEILQADPKLETYISMINHIMDTYIRGSGYSIENDFEGTQTQVGVMFKGKNDVETTKIKATTRQKQVEELLKIVINVYNQLERDSINGDNINFVINTSNIISKLDATQDDARIQTMINLGIATQDLIISHYYGVNDPEQISMIKEQIKKDKLEQQQISSGKQDNLEEQDKEVENDK